MKPSWNIIRGAAIFFFIREDSNGSFRLYPLLTYMYCALDLSRYYITSCLASISISGLSIREVLRLIASKILFRRLQTDMYVG